MVKDAKKKPPRVVWDPKAPGGYRFGRKPGPKPGKKKRSA